MIFVRRYSCSSAIRDFTFWTTKLQFTGVQYHSVICVLDRRPCRQNGTSLLYQAISRATCRVIIICHEEDFDYFHKLLTPGEADRQVLGRLRESKSVRLEDLQLLTEERQWEIALNFIVLTKNIENFETIKSLVIEQIGFENVSKALIQCFPWGEEAEIVSMIESLNSPIQLTNSRFQSSLFEASNLLLVLPNEQKRRLLWQRVKQTIIMDDDIGFFEDSFSSSLFNATDICRRRIEFSLIWHDEELYQTTTRQLTPYFMAYSHHLSQCFDALPSPMKKEINCAPLINEVEIFPEWEILRDHFVPEQRRHHSMVSLGFLNEEFAIQSKLSEKYTGKNETLKTFFLKIWNLLLESLDIYFLLIWPSEWTDKEVEIISTLDAICKQKTNETGSTDINVALEISRAVSDVCNEVFRKIRSKERIEGMEYPMEDY